MGKIRIIAFYLIALIGIILEIIFLFLIPYYYYSKFLKYLKIVRVILGFVIFLIDIYFRFTEFSEIIWNFKNKIKKKDEHIQEKNIFYLIDKIFIISGFVISLTSLILNIIGIALISDYLSKDNSTDLQNTYWTRSLIFLFENILVTICWIYFSIYWALNIYNFKNKSKEKEINIEKEEIKDDNNAGGEAPPPENAQIENRQMSSEREDFVIQ
jgi:hypothetical protein